MAMPGSRGHWLGLGVLVVLLAGGGAISFVPLNAQRGKTAGGTIAADGTYQLTTYSPGDGSMVGDFRVVILQQTEIEPEATPDGQKASRAKVVVAENERIPLIYSDYQNSPLTAKVEAQSLNVINFPLKRNPAPPAPAQPGALGKFPRNDGVAWLRR